MMNYKKLTGGGLIAGNMPIGDEKLQGELEVTRYYKSLPITYGVELQFLVPVLIKGKPDPHPNDIRYYFIVDKGAKYLDISRLVTDSILRLIRETAQVPVWTYMGPPYPDRGTLMGMDSESRAISSTEAYAQWVVTTAENLLPQNDPFANNYAWVGVKVKSNKRNSSFPSHFDQIGRVIAALRSTFRMRLAPTTSLMIHVGEVWRDPMSHEGGPRFLRVFCTLWWFLERHIQNLAHPSRHAHPDCQSLRDKSRLARMPPDKLKEGGMDDMSFAHFYQQMHFILPITTLNPLEIQQIESIWRGKNAKEITQKMLVPILQWVTMTSGDLVGKRAALPTYGRGSVGFQGFCEGALHYIPLRHNDGHTGTIEFRSMESSLDPFLIVNWLAVVTRLFDFARRGNTADIMGIISRSQVRDGSYTAIHLLQDLGLPEQARYFKDKIANHSEDCVERLDTLFVPA
ncbi:hypothetical protein F4804DRAFT_336462 [Jackrogersella minutella]|nr:hypothetical protein F4804DRAFT_336462 [Jackrogersella minutella]